MTLYAHQVEGVNFLHVRKSAMLVHEMGLGKTRCALVAAQRLYREGKIDRVLVLAPAAVRYSWREEMAKLCPPSVFNKQEHYISCLYNPKKQVVYREYEITIGDSKRDITIGDLPILIISYALLPQKRHVEALSTWCSNGKTLLVCDESSFLKNRTAKQTKGAAQLARVCQYRWLLTGTPIANSPLDLYGQSLVMSNGSRGPLSSFKNWYQFRARYATLQPMHIGRKTFAQVTGYQNIDELTKRFAPYVLRRTKAECLDLPAKSYTIREVALSEATWKIYQELRRDALLALPNEDVRPEPNAAVRILRLCQLTSGHVGLQAGFNPAGNFEENDHQAFFEMKEQDVSSEKLSWLCEQLLDGELQSEQAVIVWCRWRRERERLQQMLATKLEVYGVFGGQQDKNRSFNVQSFQSSQKQRVLVGQVHAGGFGLTLTAASTCVYLSNSFSYTDRIQSEDRAHRIGQLKPVLYVDVIAVGPRGQQTVDAHVLAALRAKRSLADTTCSAWRRVLAE